MSQKGDGWVWGDKEQLMTSAGGWRQPHLKHKLLIQSFLLQQTFIRDSLPPLTKEGR